MILLRHILSAFLFTATVASASDPAPVAAPAKKKNWSAPAQKIYAQALADRILKDHPELISVTLQGNQIGRAHV